MITAVNNLLDELKLQPGEHYAGEIIPEDAGEASYYLILLPGEAVGKTWEEANSWAAYQNGKLPTRQEQALLFANLKREFEAEWYWSGEKSSSGSVWLQYFLSGNQSNDLTLSSRLRVRAVRRVYKCSSPETKPVITPAETPGQYDVTSTLTERGNRYGKFSEHARITQSLKFECTQSANWSTLAPDQKEAIEMICHKLGRILNGDPNYADSWHDIAGYASLVDKRLATGDEI